MKRVIRSSTIESGKLLNKLQSIMKYFNKVVKVTDGYIVTEARFPDGSGNQRTLRINMKPENEDRTSYTFRYKTDDNKVQSREDKNVRERDMNEVIKEAVKEFYGLDISDDDIDLTQK